MKYKDIDGNYKEASYDEILKELRCYVNEYNTLEQDAYTNVSFNHQKTASKNFKIISEIFNMIADGTFDPHIWSDNLDEIKKRGYDTSHIQGSSGLKSICYAGAKYLEIVSGDAIMAEKRMAEIKPYIKYLQRLLEIGVD